MKQLLKGWKELLLEEIQIHTQYVCYYHFACYNVTAFWGVLVWEIDIVMGRFSSQTIGVQLTQFWCIGGKFGKKSQGYGIMHTQK